MAGVLALGLVAGGDIGCVTPSESCICTESFAFLLINVRDPAGQAATGVTLTITQVRTGQVLAVQQDVTTAGAYLILDDSFRTVIAPEGETLHVTGQKGSTAFAVDVVVKTDACHCHVSRVSGPTVVTIQ